MLAALDLQFSQTQRQRCIWHKLDNILSYVPESQRAAVELELKAIFYQDSREQADQLATAFRESTRPCTRQPWSAWAGIGKRV